MKRILRVLAAAAVIALGVAVAVSPPAAGMDGRALAALALSAVLVLGTP